MIQRRVFFKKAIYGVCLVGAAAVVGFVGGCTDSPSEAPKPTAEQEGAAKEAQNKMKEFLAKKGASGAPKKRP